MMFEARGIQDSLIGNVVNGNADIVGVFYLSNWEDVEHDLHKLKISGRYRIYDPDKNCTRFCKIGVKARFSKDNEEELIAKQDDILTTMKLAIKKEIWWQQNHDRELPTKEQLDAQDSFQVFGAVLFQTYRIDKDQNGNVIPEMVQTIEYIDDRTWVEQPPNIDIVIPEPMNFLLGEDCVIMEKTIDLAGRSEEIPR